MTRPLLAAALISLGFSAPVGRAAEPPPLGNPLGKRIVIENPCDTDGATREGRCIQAGLLAPGSRATLELAVGATVVELKGAAERERPVYLYLVDGVTGELTNDIPYETHASVDGIWRMKIDLISLEQRHWYIASAYFASTMPEWRNDAAFYQVTGTPDVPFEIVLPGAPPPPPGCGDGQRDASEQCDDGNQDSGDGCSPTCRTEPPGAPICGNRRVEAPETCDPPAAGTCSDTCRRITPGCTPEPGVCSAEEPTCDNTPTYGVNSCGDNCDKSATGCPIVLKACETDLAVSNAVQLPDGALLVQGANNPNTFFRLTPLSTTLEDSIVAALRDSLRISAINEIRTLTCGQFGPGVPSEAEISSIVKNRCSQLKTGSEPGGLDVIVTSAAKVLLTGGLSTDGTQLYVDPSRSFEAVPCGTEPEVPGSFPYCGSDHPVFGQASFTTIGFRLIKLSTGGTTEERQSCTYESVDYSPTYITGYSPIIFLRSDSPAQVQVRPSSVHFASPPLVNGAWDTEIAPDAPTHRYYEFHSAVLTQLKLQPGGWVVDGNEVEETIRGLLTSWGYETDEIETFIARDVTPALPEAPYVLVRLYDPRSVAHALPLGVTPSPASARRVLFHLMPLSGPLSITEPAVDDLLDPGGAGLRVREYGAVIVTN